MQHIRWSGLSELIAGFLGFIVVQLPEPIGQLLGSRETGHVGSGTLTTP